MKRVLFDRAKFEKGELQVNRLYAEEEEHKEEHLEDGRNIYFEGETIPFVAKLVKGGNMYFKIEDNKFTGFYEQKDKDGDYTEISIEDWQALLNKQSEGEVIFYNSKSKKLDTILLGQFETFDGTKVATDTQALKNSILSELSELKIEFAQKEFVFKDIYLQKNRDVDKANLTSIVVMLNEMKQTTFKNWKFKDTDGKDIYADITIADMLQMAGIMQSQTTNTLIAESKLIKKLETLSVEELKVFDARKEFESIIGV